VPGAELVIEAPGGMELVDLVGLVGLGGRKEGGGPNWLTPPAVTADSGLRSA